MKKDGEGLVGFGRRRRRTARAIAGTAAIVFWAVASTAAPSSTAKLDFDVPIQPVDTALIVFAKQAHIQLVVAPDALKGLPETGISGSYDMSTALQLLLRNTDLEFQFTAPATVTVRPKSTNKQ